MKWRQLLYSLKPIGTAGLFGTLMASYFANLAVPGVSSVARAWLVAKREDLKVTAVLATVAIERLIGGIVLTGLVPLTLAVIVVLGPNGLQNTLTGLQGSASPCLHFCSSRWQATERR